MALETLYIIGLIFMSLTTMLGLPGPMLVAIGTVIYGFQTGFVTFSSGMTILFVILGVVGLVIDNLFTLLGAKKLGASKYGVIGAFVGFFSIFVIGPIGVMVGPPLCAFLAELLVSKKSPELAAKAALGAVLGMVTGIIAKFLLSIAMVIWFAIVVL